MKIALFLALALGFAAATLPVNDFSYTANDWFTTQFNYLMLAIIYPWSFIIGAFAAIFGAPEWFHENAWTATTVTWIMPAYGTYF
jgi:hypothetical protein